MPSSVTPSVSKIVTVYKSHPSTGFQDSFACVASICVKVGTTVFLLSVTNDTLCASEIVSNASKEISPSEEIVIVWSEVMFLIKDMPSSSYKYQYALASSGFGSTIFSFPSEIVNIFP